MSAPKRSSRKSSPSGSRTPFFETGATGIRRNAELAIYGLTALILWPLPLVNRLHVESMAVLAFVAFFVSGRAAYLRLPGEGLFGVLKGRLAKLLLPVGLLTVAAVWAPNCDYLRGLLFAPLFPGITTVLAVSLAYFFAVQGFPFRYFVAIGIAVAIAGPLYDIGFHPQFYTYNHVFGGVLGPIYDEELALRPGLYWFRGLTLLWAALFLLAARRRLGLEPSLRRVGLVVIAIGFSYLFAAPLGFNTPAWYLQERLEGIRLTEHFAIHYVPASVDASEVERWAEEHEFRYARLREVLDLDVGERIHSYVYPDESVRSALTGARLTSVAPVWLSRPQMHVLADQIEHVFAHELSHVFAREFGLPVLNASLSVGLVEGFAVATEPPDGTPPAHHMVVASELFLESTPEELARRVAATLSPSGFWTGRGAVSYTVSGSFTKYLLDAYGVEPFKRAYPCGAFEDAYGKPAEELAVEWIAFLSRLDALDRDAAWRASVAFSVPSLFERTCPHWVPPEVRTLEKAAAMLDEGRVEPALALFASVLGKHPESPAARIGWGRARLAAGGEADVLDTLAARPRELLTTAEAGLLADALALSGRADAAQAAYADVRSRYPYYARESRAIWMLRELTSPYPDILRVLVSVASAKERRERLRAVVVEREIETSRDVTPGNLWMALLAAEDGAWSDALAAVERTLSFTAGPCSPTSGTGLGRRCEVWAAVYAYRAGDIDRAVAYTASALARYEAAGDASAVLALSDFRDKLMWLAERPAELGIQD